MALSNRAVTVGAAVIVIAIGAEAYVRQQQVQTLRETIAAVSAQRQTAETAARRTEELAVQAGANADQAATAAAQAKETADRALAMAATAKETADHASVAAVPSPPPPTTQTAAASDLAAGRELALQICANCHVVARNQPFPPRLNPPAPDFGVIASRSAVTEQGVRDFLASPHGKMPDPMLAGYQIDLLAGYLISRRDRR